MLVPVAVRAAWQPPYAEGEGKRFAASLAQWLALLSKAGSCLPYAGGVKRFLRCHATRAEPRKPDGGWRAEAKAGGARTCGRGARSSPASGMCETGREETMDGTETPRRKAPPPQPGPASTPGGARLLYGVEDTDAALAHPDTLSCILGIAQARRPQLHRRRLPLGGLRVPWARCGLRLARHGEHRSHGLPAHAGLIGQNPERFRPYRSGHGPTPARVTVKALCGTLRSRSSIIRSTSPAGPL